MKKIFLGIVTAFIFQLSFGQGSVTIKGSFHTQRFYEVKLFKVENGVPKSIATSQPNQKGEFGFLFNPEYEGLYLVGIGNSTSQNGNYQFWLKAGDQLVISFTDSTYELAGKNNSTENKILYQWYQLIRPVEWKSIYFNKTISTYVDFFPLLTKKIPEAKAWLMSQRPSGNKKFDSALKEIVKFDIPYYAINFLNTPRSAHPDNEEIPEYYKDFTIGKTMPIAQIVYSQPYGLRAFSSMLMRDMMHAGSKDNKDKYSVDAGLKLIPNDTLKGDFIIQRAGGFRDYGKYIEFKNEYEKYLITDNQKEQEFKIYSNLATLKPGDKGYEFKYEDKDGKLVSFSDFKGKVVLIDTWATWCGPCKQEIPHLKKLEKEMEGKDIAIVSISVDEAADKDKWKQMIKDENLGGTQLFAIGWSDITKYYKISGIPRFMVFDKEGKIVTVDAPRPSSPDLKPLLEKYIEKP